MLELISRNFRFLARLGAQGALGQAVYDLAKDNYDFYAVSADLGVASGFERVMEQYPEKYIETGIAEQSMMSVAAGMATDNCPCIATSWAPFATYRCADQARVFMGLMKQNVKLVGLGSGLHISYFGGSHYGIGDIAVMQAIPNVTILAPADGMSIYHAVIQAVKNNSPTYIRLTGGDLLPMIYNESNFHFEIGKGNQIRQGSDVVFISNGYILSEVLKACEQLEMRGISTSVIDMHTIKPLDYDIIDANLNHKLVVVVEEHSVYGGLGAAVSMHLATRGDAPPVLQIAINDWIPEAGSLEYLLEKCGLDADSIVKSVCRALERE